MTDSLEIIMRLVATVLLISVNALYVFHEFAFVALKPSDLRRLDKEQTRRSRLITDTAHRLDHYIAVDQLGITVSSLAVGWIGQPAVTFIITSLFGEIGLSSAAMTAISAIIAFALLTSTQMIVGELMPKTFALRHAEVTARWVARPVEWTAKVFHPLVVMLNGVGLGLVRLMGFEGKSNAHDHKIPAEELIAMVQSSARAGVLKTDPQALSRLLHFSDLEAHDLMVPRLDVVGVPDDATFEEVIRTAQRHRYDKYPVYQGSIDQIIGMVSAKNLIVNKSTRDADGSRPWLGSVKPIPTLPATAPVEILLKTFQKSQQQMILLVDEYGATEGIVSVTDVTEQLIEGPDEIHTGTAGGSRIEGHASISVVEAELDINLHSEQRSADTIAGLVLEELGRIPDQGDSVIVDGHEIEVARMEGYRIVEVDVTKLSDTYDDPGITDTSRGNI